MAGRARLDHRTSKAGALPSIENFGNADHLSRDRSRSPSSRRSAHRRQPGNGNARGAWMPHVRDAARIIQSGRAEIGLQQRELHQVELCAATADAFEFASNRFKRVDRGREIAPFESGEGVRYRRDAGPDG